MSSTHLKSLQTINAQTLKKGLDQQSVTLIDVREPAEFVREHIPGAILVSLSLFDPVKFLQRMKHNWCCTVALAIVQQSRLKNYLKLASSKLLTSPVVLPAGRKLDTPL